MATEYIIGLSLASFGVGVGFGMILPFLLITVYRKLTSAFDIDVAERSVA